LWIAASTSMTATMDHKPEKTEPSTASVSDVASGIVDNVTIELDPALERRTLRKFDKYLLPPLALILLLGEWSLPEKHRQI
jgi:hypothetical protein